MKRVALTFIGKDRPGIIAEVSRVLFKAGGNIEDTTMTILEGEFAMILIASIPSAQAAKKLKGEFIRLKKRWGLNHFEKSLSSDLSRGKKHLSGTDTSIVTVMGRDRTGIVYETSRALAGQGLNITDLNSKILGHGKKAVFAMMLEVDIPKGFPMKKLEPAWNRLRKRLKVEVQIKQAEHLSL